MKTDFKNGTATFILPHWRTDNDLSRHHLDSAVESILKQTDTNWRLIVIDDNSPSREAKEYLKVIKNKAKQKIDVLCLDKNQGAGIARNIGIQYAYKKNSPFILFNDQDDISHSNRLKRVRESFCNNENVNVVYSTFKIIDETGRLVTPDNICPAIKEILDGHKKDIVSGENAWIKIATKKNYTNLTSSTAVRTSLAYIEPFNSALASEDANAWLRYGAHKGSFIYDETIPTLYRIPRNTECASRARNDNFYEVKADIDTDGFFKAMEIALENKSIRLDDCDKLTVQFYLKLAESLIISSQQELAFMQIKKAENISKVMTNKYIEKYTRLTELFIYK